MANVRFAALVVAACGIGMSQAHADVLPWPFETTRPTHSPLAFGMDPATVANALQAPLTYVSGRPGNEIFVAPRTNGGTPLAQRDDRLYLQFRHGRLTGWKGDWGRNWMWR